jgi:hypothetical protein
VFFGGRRRTVDRAAAEFYRAMLHPRRKTIMTNRYSEKALAALGLQPRRSAADYIVPALGLFGVGVLVGAGLGLLLAPKRGQELRGELRHGFTNAVRGVGSRIRRRRREESDGGAIIVQDESFVEDAEPATR